MGHGQGYDEVLLSTLSGFRCLFVAEIARSRLFHAKSNAALEQTRVSVLS